MSNAIVPSLRTVARLAVWRVAVPTIPTCPISIGREIFHTFLPYGSTHTATNSPLRSKDNGFQQIFRAAINLAIDEVPRSERTHFVNEYSITALTAMASNSSLGAATPSPRVRFTHPYVDLEFAPWHELFLETHLGKTLSSSTRISGTHSTLRHHDPAREICRAPEISHAFSLARDTVRQKGTRAFRCSDPTPHT
jgi:hypothetical protein